VGDCGGSFTFKIMNFIVKPTKEADERYGGAIE
jgi:hypothetical protein